MTLRRRRPGLVYPTWEDWAYVGSGGSAPDWYDPGSGDSWENAGVTFNLGFRIRETGILDIAGMVQATADPPTSSYVFQLPTGYRPSSLSRGATTGRTTSALEVALEIYVYDNGLVEINKGSIDPYPAPGCVDALEYAVLALQVFLNPVDAP